jgi:hypothetical protein
MNEVDAGHDRATSSARRDADKPLTPKPLTRLGEDGLFKEEGARKGGIRPPPHMTHVSSSSKVSVKEEGARKGGIRPGLRN